jgi:hypothetical protein
MLAPFDEPAVNEIDAEPLPDVADNDVGAAGAVAVTDTPHDESLLDNQLPVDAPITLMARTYHR